MDHNWAVESPRLRGIKLFDERRVPGRAESVIQMAQVGGQCVFLEEDQLCLIHKVLGLAAKPASCKLFPVRLGSSPEGILLGADYACPSVIRNEGEPFALLEQAAGEQLGWDGLAPAVHHGMEINPELVPGFLMPWPVYLAVESSLLGLLWTADCPVTSRVAAGRQLLSAMALEWDGRRDVDTDSARKWLAARRNLAHLSPDLMEGESVSPVLQPVATLARLIGSAEAPHSSTSGAGSAAIGYAMAVAGEAGRLYLSTLNSTVDLTEASRVTCEMDAPSYSGYLTRFLANYVMRKSLLASPNLKDGWDYLCSCFSLIQWYARVSATHGGRAAAGDDDVVMGIQVVEKAYVP